MPAPKLLLWIDFESTGLLTDETPPTLLEGAWTVTDTHGRQVTPLSQVFTALPTFNGLWRGRTHQPIITPAERDPADFSTAADYADRANWWPDGDMSSYPAQPVREMHRDNGLNREWLEFSQGPDQHRIIRDWREIERMLLDTLDMAGWRGLDRGQVLLAGGGVSHYEDRFLRPFCARVFDDKRVHYSTGADVSTVLRTLRTRALASPGVDEEGGFPGTADRLIERHVPDMRDPDADVSWAEIRLNLHRYDAADRCGWTRTVDADGRYTEQVTPHWALAEKDSHRAAPGIARALMAYRLLPRLLVDASAALLDPAF